MVINGIEYLLPEINFQEVLLLNKYGFDALDPNAYETVNIAPTAIAFAALAMGNKEIAIVEIGEEIEKNGFGVLQKILEEGVEALENSGFLSKALKATADNVKPAPGKKPKRNTKASSK